MIITLTPNPAHDITYAVESVTLGASHRVSQVSERAGGKGVNTAAILSRMGRSCVAVAPVGGPGRTAYADDLRRRGVRGVLVDTDVPTRRSVAVVDREGQATLFNEPGGAQPADVWERLSSVVAGLVTEARVLTISGSLPEGADPAVVLRLARRAQKSGLRVVVDGGGAPLARALEAAPALVKPNLAEANAALGTRLCGPFAAAEAARLLVAAGARAAVVSDGARGLCLCSGGPGGIELHARLRTPLRGNATGAGDALTASLAADLDDLAGHGELLEFDEAGKLDDAEEAGEPGEPSDPKSLLIGLDEWAEILRRAVAWSAAAVLQPVAGAIDPADVDRLLPDIEIEETSA